MVRATRRTVLRTTAVGGAVGLAGCLGGPDPNEWDDTFGDDAQQTFFWDVLPTEDGGYLAVGSDRTEQNSQDGLLVKYDAEGEEQWRETHGGQQYDWFAGVEPTDDGYVVAGTKFTEEGAQAWQVGIEEDGDADWEETYQASSLTYGWRMISGVDDGFLLIGHTSEDQQTWRPMLLKTDEDGDEEWRDTYRPEDATTARFTGGLARDDGYLVTGHARPADADQSVGYVVGVETDGDVEWRETYDDGRLERPLSNDDGYLVTGTHVESSDDQEGLLLAIDEAGDERWTETYVGDEFASLTDVVPRQGDGGLLGGLLGGGADGYVAAGLSGQSASDHEAVLLSVDGEGALEAETEWDAATGAAWAVEQTDDGGYVAIGWVDEDGSENDTEQPQGRIETFADIDDE